MELIKLAAEALLRDRSGTGAIKEETLDLLSRIPSQRLPDVLVPAWQVSARYKGEDETFRIVSYTVMAANPERARSKAATGNKIGDTKQWEPFPESAIVSVEKADSLALFASSVRELVAGSRSHHPGFYDVDPTLLKQARALALVVGQQLV